MIRSTDTVLTHRYALESKDASYFVKAARDPLDYIRKRFENASQFGEVERPFVLLWTIVLLLLS